MAKNSFYFSHDTGARNDPKLQKVLMKLGHEGKSVFWDLVEMLYEEGGYLKISEFDNYAFALRTDETCIATLVNSFGLFENDGEKFWSNSVLRRINQQEEKSKKATESALKRWEKANALKSDTNALKSDAIKEKKRNNINSIISFDVFWDLYGKKVGDKNRCEKKWNALPPKEQEKIIDTLPEWKSNIRDTNFQPFPETFLNQQRWNDEIIPSTAPAIINGSKVIDQSNNKNLFGVS